MKGPGYFTKPTVVESYRVYREEDVVFLGVLTKWGESEMWQFENSRLGFYIHGTDRDALVQEAREYLNKVMPIQGESL